MAVKKRGESTERRPTLYTCANCDGGWIPEVYETTVWKVDGKRYSRQIPYVWPMPERYEAGDRWVTYHSAVRRCPCTKLELVKELPEQEQMPRQIADTKLGAIVKRMPEPGGFW